VFAKTTGVSAATIFDHRVAQRRTDTERALAEIPSPQRAVIVNRALSTFRGQLKRESVETRTAHVREAGVIANVAARAKQHFQSPVQILMREGLGSERRSRLLQQIEYSGSTELAGLAALAASTGDKEMGAALISRVNRLDPGDRPFGSRNRSFYAFVYRRLNGDRHTSAQRDVQVALIAQAFD